MAALMGSAMPASVTAPMAEAVISDATATGPTERVLLEPNAAYSNNGPIEAYSPISGGKPASSA